MLILEEILSVGRVGRVGMVVTIVNPFELVVMNVMTPSSLFTVLETNADVDRRCIRWGCIAFLHRPHTNEMNTTLCDIPRLALFRTDDTCVPAMHREPCRRKRVRWKERRRMDRIKWPLPAPRQRTTLSPDVSHCVTR